MADEDPALDLARKHVEDVRNFFYHLMTYVLVNALLIVIDRRNGISGDVVGLDWAFWVIIFWGFGVAGHAIYVFFGEYRVRRLYQKVRQP